MLNKVNFQIDFEFGYLDKRYMSCWVNDVLVDPKQQTMVTHSMDIILPTKINLVFCGKNPTDTKIDNTGKIVEDMHIKILNIRLDQIGLPKWIIESKLKLTTDTNKIFNTSYIGFNGKIVLEMEKSNVFTQYQKFKTL